MPKISVIIIAYNRAGFLPQAIESVLTQSFTEWELILIDDGSTDETKIIMQDYAKKDQRIRCLFNETNLGICKTRARGLAEAKGEFVAVLDSDDIWCDQDKLKKQIEFLKNNLDHVLVGGGVVVVDKNNQELKKYFNVSSDISIRQKILLKNPFAHSTVVYRRDIAQAVGGYRQELIGREINGIEDYDLWLRLGTKGKLANLPEYFVRYRSHSGNISVQKRLQLMEITLLLIKHHQLFYPHFWLAWLRRITRLLVYKFYKFFIR